MSNSLLFHSCGIRGFDHIKWNYVGKRSSVETITRKPDGFSCSACGSRSVTATKVGKRLIINGKIGGNAWIIEVETHRVRCHDCSAFLMERLPFLSTPKSRVTQSLERTILELRPEMSISALSQYFGVDWRTVKDIEKRMLLKKYARIDLSEVRIMGVDEIYVGKKKYKTVVRGLENGCVLHVGDGKGGKAMGELHVKLAHAGARIEVVAMDMSSGYSAWARENLPGAEIVFDHFHVIKLMNDKLDKIRRRVVVDLDEKALSKVKKNVFCS